MRETKTIYLHIGTEKTGTTTIQHFLWKNKEKLSKQGYIYPEFLGISHGRLVLYSSNYNRSLDIQKRRHMSQKDYDKFQATFPGIFNKKLKDLIKKYSVIISSEHLSSRIRKKDELLKLYKLLSKISKNIKVVIYLRRQDKFLLSLYSTAVKNGCSKKFSKWVNNFTYLDLNYYQLLNFWSTVFGKENIIVKIFDKRRFKNNNLIDDFCSIFPINLKELQSVKNENLSLGAREIKLLRLVNSLYPGLKYKKWKDSLLFKIVSKINFRLFSKNNFRINQKVLNDIINKYKKSNKLVIKKYLNLQYKELF